jgi:hypothetical protein
MFLTPAAGLPAMYFHGPWQRDYLVGKRSRVPMVKLWAYDHIFFGRDLPLISESSKHS